MLSRRFAFVLLSLPLACSGCASASFMQLNAFAVGYAVGRASAQPAVAVDTPAEEEDSEPRVEYVARGPVQPVDMEPPSPAAPAERPFDLGGAYAAMARVDLGACKSDGLAVGYGRAVVAFAPDGSLNVLSIELPPASSSGARTCVDSTFRTVRVPAFAGAQRTTVRRAFYVT